MLETYGFQNWIAGETPRKLVYVVLEVQIRRQTFEASWYFRSFGTQPSYFHIIQIIIIPYQLNFCILTGALLVSYGTVKVKI